MEPKCTLHGSSASIMSVQFDQVVSVYEGRVIKQERGVTLMSPIRQICNQSQDKDLKSSLENRYPLNCCVILFHNPSLS